MVFIGHYVASAGSVSPAEFFAGVDWSETAPKALVREARSGDSIRCASLLTARLAGLVRDGSRGFSEALKQSLWSRAHWPRTARASLLIERWHAFDSLKALKSQWGLASWIEVAETRDPLSDLEALVLFEVIRTAGAKVSSETGCRLWRLALATLTDLESRADHGADQLREVREAELAWQAGLLCSPVRGADRVLAKGRESLKQVLVSATDAAGVPTAEWIESLPLWIISLVRARDWGLRFRQPLFGAADDKRYRCLIASIAPLCQRNGRPALANGCVPRGAEADSALDGFWQSAAESIRGRVRVPSPAMHYLASVGNGRPSGPAVGNRRLKGPAIRNGRLAGPAKRRSQPSTSKRTKSAPKERRPSFHSETSRLACLRNDWSAHANTLAVAYQRPFPRIELAAHGRTLLSGDWEIELRLDGETVPFTNAWTSACWYSDEEADYLELQADGPGGVRVERQILLSRTDDLAFLADAISGAGDARIDYVSRLTAAFDARGADASSTRDVRLVRAAGRDGKSRIEGASARFYPLALPCDRKVQGLGKLAVAKGRLELWQTGKGAMYAPLLIDWAPSRARSTAMWKPLTVGQDGRIIPPHVAAGYRLQVAQSQWLVYRSLARILEPRTVLGHHTMYETVVGRFLPNGNVESIMSVEQSAEAK